MKFLDRLFGRTEEKQRIVEQLNRELAISVERIKKNKEQQEILQRATMDGEDGWFYRVCVDPQIFKPERKNHGTISNNATGLADS